MLLRRTPLLIAAALLLSAPGALAQEEPAEEIEATREAGYLGLSVIGGWETMSASDSVGLTPGDSAGIAAQMGFRMMEWVSVEFEGEWLAGLGDGIDNPWNITANIKAIYPFGPQQRIQPYFIGGAGVMSANVTRSGVSTTATDGVFKVGGGIDVFATRNIVAYGQAVWVSGMSTLPGISYMAARFGVTYVFR